MDSKDAFVILFSYGLGCIATGYYLVRWRTGQDVRHLGSGSVGARNTGRVLGRWGFWAALTGDLLKGTAAVTAGRLLGASSTAAALSVTAVAAGHVFPIQLRFRGGKGIAVSLGALLALDVRIAAVWGIVFAVLFLCSRRFLISGLLSVLSIPAAAPALGLPVMTSLSLVLLAGLIFLAHRNNIANLLRSRRSSESMTDV